MGSVQDMTWQTLPSVLAASALWVPLCTKPELRGQLWGSSAAQVLSTVQPTPLLANLFLVGHGHPI